MTDYERGRLAGFAEGVEAAKFAASPEYPDAVRQIDRRLPLRAPSPKEDAPRCHNCDGSGRCKHHGEKCPRCGGAGRATTGGGR